MRIFHLITDTPILTILYIWDANIDQDIIEHEFEKLMGCIENSYNVQSISQTRPSIIEIEVKYYCTAFPIIMRIHKKSNGLSYRLEYKLSCI